jgi:LuxR family transcriptional regulator, maltose regulon positive regulatory protein
VKLVRTKLDPPVEPGELIDRPRLLQCLDKAAQVRLTVLQTPAGYGKTSLLSQWFCALEQSHGHAAWLSLDRTDGEAVDVLAYVAAALSKAGVSFAPPIEQQLNAYGFSTPNSLIAAIIDGLEGYPNSVFLFVDDVHLLSAVSMSALGQLIERGPANLRFILAARATPDIHVARMRARGQLLELGVKDLVFSAAETRQFIAAASEYELSETQLAILQERTEGWVAAIKLASLALRQGSSPQEVLTSFTGSRRSVSDFFAEEVIASLPQEAREFLLQTSVLERLCPALCNAITGRDDGRQMLNFIEQSGLFLLQLDDERNWYRYHHLFAEFLQRRLLDERPRDDAKLHRLASRWFWDQQLEAEAIEHALRGADPQRAADLLEQRCQDMIYVGKLPLVSQFASRIPEHILHRCPRILLSHAWLLTRQLQFEETRAILKLVGNLLQELEAAAQPPAAELRRLNYLLLHREMVLSAAEDDAPRVEEQCRHLIDNFPEETHPYLVGTIYSMLIYAQREQYQLGNLDRLTATAQGILARSRYNFGSIALQASIGPSLFFAGRTDAARRALEHGLAQGIRYGGRISALAALPALPLCEALYENNELDRAQELIAGALPRATELGFVDQLLPGYITQARVQHARGHLTEAMQTLDEAMSIAMGHKLERLRLAVVAERVKFLIQDGSADQALRFARSAGIPQSSENLIPKRNVTTRDELRALAWFRIALSENRTHDAICVGKHWRSFCAAKGATRSLIRWDILLAHAMFISGDLRAAQRALREATTHAAASRQIRSFIDEGPVVRTLLERTYEADLEVLHPADAFAAELLETFDKEVGAKRHAPRSAASAASTEGLYGKLSVKEREILALVSSGMRNREVAQKLGMTEGSVKWYMQQVYDKIGTRRRLQAVERARQFGVIA